MNTISQLHLIHVIVILTSMGDNHVLVNIMLFTLGSEICYKVHMKTCESRYRNVTGR